MTKIGDYNKIMSDRNLFNQIVYTPLSDALRLLEERRNDPELVAKVEKLLKGNIPEFLKENKCGIRFRQIATPNEENRYFAKLAKDNKLKPTFFEYYDDKFTSNNEFKHSLGQLRIHNGLDKKGEYKTEKITIVDFAKHDGDLLKDVLTIWSESLIDFHHKLFEMHSVKKNDIILYDASNWLKKNGGKASQYYINFFLLSVCHGILFENFLTKGAEGEFSKSVVLPAIEKIETLLGIKPLIVPIPPMDLEEHEHCISYQPKVKSLINL